MSRSCSNIFLVRAVLSFESISNNLTATRCPSNNPRRTVEKRPVFMISLPISICFGSIDLFNGSALIKDDCSACFSSSTVLSRCFFFIRRKQNRFIKFRRTTISKTTINEINKKTAIETITTIDEYRQNHADEQFLAEKNSLIKQKQNWIQPTWSVCFFIALESVLNERRIRSKTVESGNYDLVDSRTKRTDWYCYCIDLGRNSNVGTYSRDWWISSSIDFDFDRFCLLLDHTYSPCLARSDRPETEWKSYRKCHLDDLAHSGHKFRRRRDTSSSIDMYRCCSVDIGETSWGRVELRANIKDKCRAEINGRRLFKPASRKMNVSLRRLVLTNIEAQRAKDLSSIERGSSAIRTLQSSNVR